MMVAAFAVSFAAVLSKAALYAEPVRARNRLGTRDFETTRKDGRFENHMAFARDYVRRMVPEFSFDKVKAAEELPAGCARLTTTSRSSSSRGS